ncbi:60S acidic ribosomal protein P3-like [Tripterygium wilfordii]|uniref:60S acidic ribosomal protein P3-like n=1 Tax=Tripterygium wilfordii TaxID=458696 RepID=A0A7J7C4N7_TRIWF|nr:60S acidic ribosomal protein P3-2-like [Tripterygium wilfordii]KAF5729093.1 60S acidic ribosomal protein P3-like [Tripterygium wilfordii]
MGVYTFVCRSSGDEWTGKQLSGDLEASASSTYDLQRKLVQTALSVDSSGGVSTSFSIITPSSGVFQVVVGGSAVGGAAAAAAAPGGGSAPAAEEKKEEEKKPEKEESEDEDMGFSLFD